MRILLNTDKTQALVERGDGGSFTLSASCQSELIDLLSMWTQDLSTWDGSFKTASQIKASKDNTIEICISAA